MFKILTLLFCLFLPITSLAGGWLSKMAEPEKHWIAMPKPTGEDLSMWEWLSSKYNIDTKNYEEDIEFALPNKWRCEMSQDRKIYFVKNAEGVVLMMLLGSKNNPATVVFSQKNIEILQKSK